MQTSVNPIPGSIVKAVCAVQATLESVKKSQRNTHGNYMYASTDDIYAAVTRKMGEVGLICMGLEDAEPEIKVVEKETEKGRTTSQWMKVAYNFILATEDATWTDPRSRRTLYIQITGPQTFQAAQSYAEKSYLRSLFKIPTGDMDLDSLPENYEYAPIAFKGRSNGSAAAMDAPPAPAEAKPAPQEEPKAAEAPPVEQEPISGEEILDELRIALQGAKTEDESLDAWDELSERICLAGMKVRDKGQAILGEHLGKLPKLIEAKQEIPAAAFIPSETAAFDMMSVPAAE